MKRLKLFLLLFGIFAFGYVGLTFLLKWIGIYNVYAVSIIKFLCSIVIPILFLKWNEHITTFKFASIFLIVLDFTILFIELVSGNTVLYLFMHSLVPIPIILFLVLTIMSHERFIYGSRVTAFVSLISIILVVRFNSFTALIIHGRGSLEGNADIIMEAFKVDHIYYIIMSIVIYLLSLLMLDAVYEEKIRNWK